MKGPVDNPFDPPRSWSEAQNTAPRASPDPVYGRWWIALVVGSLGLFVAWCGIDFLWVRYDFRTSDAPLGVALLLLFFWNVRFSRPHPAWFLRSVALTVASAVIALVLVILLGIPFHFAIGGSF